MDMRDTLQSFEGLAASVQRAILVENKLNLCDQELFIFQFSSVASI